MTDSYGSLSGLIAERYAIEREIGRGGMAVVYLARDLRHDAQVAIKVLNPELAARVGPERFSREIRITANLQHPAILSVFDSGEVDGLPFCVMPYVEGETLASRIEREGALPIEDALSIASEIAEALAFAHAQGFVHRDVKPSNILLSHGHAQLADFGIARAIDAAGQVQLTTAGLAMGTASYMSPEQASGENVDGRSDIYSLGCVLYEMLAGSPPFAGTTTRAILARHLADAVPSIRTVRDTVSPALEAAIVRAMAKLPADRFTDATEFRGAIRNATHHPATPQRRFMGIVLSTAAVIVLVLAALFGRRFMGAGAGAPDGVDPNRIMVFPLVVSEGFPSDQRSVGEDVATMISNALDRAGPLRLIDGWAKLDPKRREDIRELTDDEARAIARAQRCGYYVTGRIDRRGADSAEVSLLLNDTEGRDDPRRARSLAPSGEAWRGFRAVNEFLPVLIGGGTADVVAEWEARPPLAIAQFLLGEAAFRRIHLDSAVGNYRAAVSIDSSFSIAAIRGAQAASWAHDYREASALIETALRHPLQPRYAAFAEGYKAYLEGRADSAIAAFRTALAIDDEMTVTWLQLGETWTHLLPEAGAPDDSALAAFDRVMRLDSTAVNALFHVIEILLRKGDAGRAEPLIDRLLEAAPQGNYADEIQIMFDCVSRGPDGVPWTQLARERAFPLLAASAQMTAGGSQLSCAMAGFSALLENDTLPDGDAAGRRFWALYGIQAALLAQGREEEAAREIDAYYARWNSGASLFLLGAPLYGGYVQRAGEIAREDADRFGPRYERLEFRTRLWELGIFEAWNGDLDVARGVAAELAGRSDRSGSPHDGLLAASLLAHIALKDGDVEDAYRSFDDLVPAVAPADGLRYSEDTPLGFERLEFARMLVERGEYRRAIDVAAVFDSPWPLVYSMFIAPSLELRAEAAAALSEDRLATQFRDRLAAMQRRPEAE